MDDKVYELQRHAAHCRLMARSSIRERTRANLFTLALQLEDRADAINLAK